MRLSSLDTAILVISIGMAIALWVVRWAKEVAAAPGQGLFDMLGVWTTIELFLIAAASVQQDWFLRGGLRLPEPAELIKGNGPLVPIALIYSAILVARSSFISSIIALAFHEKRR